MSENKIYELVTATRHPFKLPGPWAHIRCAHGFFRPRLDRARLLAELEGKFTRDELVASGVAVMNATGTLDLVTALAHDSALLFAARRGETLGPFDLIVEGATLQSSIPVLAMVDDYRMADALSNHDDNLLVVFSLLDAAIFTTLGFPAALASGLDHIGGRQLTALCKSLGLDRRTLSDAELDRVPRRRAIRKGDSRQDPVALTLVAWSIAELAPTGPQALQPVQDHLRDLVRYLGSGFKDVRVWKPSTADFDRFAYCVANGDAQDITAALTDSLDQCDRQRSDQAGAQKYAPKSYAEAANKWMTIQHNPLDAQRKKLAWDQVEHLLDAELIAPILEWAHATTDPAQRNLAVTLADISRTFHLGSLLLTGDLAKKAREKGANNSWALPKEEFQQLLALGDRVLALTRQVQQSSAN